jgi:glyoxylase-like metal-dependent hydrolase (beta-lactamase superfamily II)
MATSSHLHIEEFFHEDTSTFSYLVLDSRNQHCAVIDSVLDYDPKSGRTHTTSADKLLTRITELGAKVEWIVETHVHADHLTAAPYLKAKTGGRTGIGKDITGVQKVFGALFNAGPEFATDGSQFDHLFERDAHARAHPACMTYVVKDTDQTAAFVGDTLFMPDYGTARCDFPGGDARTLFRSINKVLSLPPETRLYMCHDYQPGGARCSTSAPWPTSARATCTCATASAKRAFVAMRMRATPRWACPR